MRDKKPMVHRLDGTIMTDKTITEWILDTGSDQSQVDERRTTSNHIIEIVNVLWGCAQCCAQRAPMVLQLYSDMNYRHVVILADVMTESGSLMPIARHGINRQETGPCCIPRSKGPPSKSSRLLHSVSLTT